MRLVVNSTSDRLAHGAPDLVHNAAAECFGLGGAFKPSGSQALGLRHNTNFRPFYSKILSPRETITIADFCDFTVDFSIASCVKGKFSPGV